MNTKQTYQKLIDLWSHTSLDTPCIAHADKEVMKMSPSSNSILNFDFRYIPQPYWGNIKDPKLIILTLNPGFSTPEEYKLNEVRKTDFINNLCQSPSLNWLKMHETKGKNWWYKTIKDFKADDVIYQKVGFFELYGYHSKSFKSSEYKSIRDLNKKVFGIANGKLPTQEAMLNHLTALFEQDNPPLVAIIWGQKFWLQGLPILKEKLIDYIDTRSTQSHHLSEGNIRPIDLNRIRNCLKD